MRTVLKILAGLIGIYVLAWCALAIYFSYAERHKGLLEANLSALFKREVTIAEIRTGWSGSSPVLQIKGFRVAGDTAEIPALAFTSMSAQVAPLSILRLWPKLTNLAVQEPILEVVSLPGNKLQIAGITIADKQAKVVSPKRLISWLLNHQAATWLNGEVVWRRATGIQRYRDVSFVYERVGEDRTLSAATKTPKGAIAFSAEAHGNPLIDDDWGASVEVLGDQGRRLLAPDDLSLVVENGQGRVQLKALTVERLRDFLLLTGLGEAAAWILDAELNGTLENVQFDFSGPFLAFRDWSLQAGAKGISFLATSGTPGLTELRGKVTASAAGGVFKFATDQSVFQWPKIFADTFTIERAAGEFVWEFTADGSLDVRLQDGEFADGNLTITGLNASCKIGQQDNAIENIADLFTVESVAELSYQDGKVVSSKETDAGAWGGTRLFLDAQAQFSIAAFADTTKYLPRDPRISKLRSWWVNAFTAGQASDGRLRYQGEVSRTALQSGKAQFTGSANFSGVDLDYGYQRAWPMLRNANGRAEFNNDILTLRATQAWLAEDKIDTAKVAIGPLSKPSRAVHINGSLQSSVATVMDFLFAGPLLAPTAANPSNNAVGSSETTSLEFPIRGAGGSVAANIEVNIPLADVRQTTVNGSGEVKAGKLILPQGVAIENINTTVKFTERSASAERITGQFLDGDISAKLVTTKAAQPPSFSIQASGNGRIGALKPWVGGHLLSWLEGRTDWQGEVLIDSGTDGTKVAILAESELLGVAVTAPPPLSKASEQPEKLNFAMRVGSKKIEQELVLDYGDSLRVHLRGDRQQGNSLLDRAYIAIADNVRSREVITPLGVNFLLASNDLDLDAWLQAIIGLATLQLDPAKEEVDTLFLDAMRGVKINAADPLLLGRRVGPLNVTAASTDGRDWIGTIIGDNVNGTIQAAPRSAEPSYRLNFSLLNLPAAPKNKQPPKAIDTSLKPSSYPRLELNANTFITANKDLGRLQLVGQANGDIWELTQMSLDDTDIRTVGSGQWVNNEQSGSLSQFEITTTIDEAGGVLDEMQFNDLIRKGEGRFVGKLNWIGAPHEFDYQRLNGDFELQINDGELVQVESGAGKLVGLLNFNSILRRLTLDFRDVFSSGLTFDRMQYTGILADGKAIMREAYMLSPAVFVQMEGNIDLANEYIDLEIHASPELGGNLALLSALANPAAGAVVYLTQRIFKDQMRASSFSSYRALGSWDDFELAEIKEPPPSSKSSRVGRSSSKK